LLLGVAGVFAGYPISAVLGTHSGHFLGKSLNTLAR